MGALRVQALSRQGHPTAQGCVLGSSSSPLLTSAPQEAGGGCLDAEPGIPCLVDPASHEDSPVSFLWTALGGSGCLHLPFFAFTPRRTPGSQCQPHA